MLKVARRTVAGVGEELPALRAVDLPGLLQHRDQLLNVHRLAQISGVLAAAPEAGRPKYRGLTSPARAKAMAATRPPEAPRTRPTRPL